MDNTAPQVTYTNAPDPTQWYNSGQPVQVNVQTPVGAAPIQSLTCDYAGRAVLSGRAAHRAGAARPAQLVGRRHPPGHRLRGAELLCGRHRGQPRRGHQRHPEGRHHGPAGVFVGNPTDPAVILAKVADDLSGVYGANIQYEQKRAWITLPTTLHGGTARAVIPANNPISVGKHPLRVVVTDNADNKYVGYDNQRGQAGDPQLPRRRRAAPALHGRPQRPRHLRASGRQHRHQLHRASRLRPGGGDQRAARHDGACPCSLTSRSGSPSGSPTASTTSPRCGPTLAAIWRYRLPAGGDRTVKVAFGGSVGLRRRKPRHHRARHAAIRLAVNPMVAGGQLFLSARVLGAAIPTHGLGLIAQWRRSANSPWQTFPRLQTRR